MELPETLNNYVSASPISLQLLKESQRLHDKQMEPYRKDIDKDQNQNEDSDFSLN